jgi:hypothetical protein
MVAVGVPTVRLRRSAENLVLCRRRLPAANPRASSMTIIFVMIPEIRAADVYRSTYTF